MIIISQDKLKTTEKMELRIYPEYKDFEIIGYRIEDSLIELGVYKTEERAKEVLQEITTARSDFEYYKNAPEKVKEEISEAMQIKYKHFDTYEMPEE